MQEHEAISIARKLRASDIADIGAATPLSPVEAVATSFRESYFQFGFFENDDCFAVGGLAHDGSTQRTSVWLVGTDHLSIVARTFGIRRSRKVLDILAPQGNVYFNFVDAENRSCRRWLRALGFVELKQIENFRELGRRVVEVIYDRRLVTVSQPVM